jgi:hypothetical protein
MRFGGGGRQAAVKGFRKLIQVQRRRPLASYAFHRNTLATKTRHRSPRPFDPLAPFQRLSFSTCQPPRPHATRYTPAQLEGAGIGAAVGLRVLTPPDTPPHSLRGRDA